MGLGKRHVVNSYRGTDARRYRGPVVDTTLSACNSTNGRDAQSHSAGPTCSSGIGLRWHYWLPAASNHNSWLRPSGSPIRPWFNVGISAHKAIASRVLGFHKGIAFRDLLSGIDKDAMHSCSSSPYLCYWLPRSCKPSKLRLPIPRAEHTRIANLQSEDHHLVRYHLAGHPNQQATRDLHV